MKSLKQRGMDRELRPLMRRTNRSWVLDRIKTEDYKYIMDRLHEVEERITTMTELE